ncbi:MAG: excisionase family DNA-binding protein [Nitrospiria bacterium]
MREKLLKAGECAKILNVSKWTVYRWVEEGKLRATKLGPGVLRIFENSVKELVENKTIDNLSQE